MSFPTRRLEGRLLLALAFAPLVGFALAAFITQPIQFPDESGMIQNARFLAGSGAQSELWYRPGYSLLLVPVVLVSSGLGQTMVGVHLVNMGLSLVTAFGLIRLGRVLAPSASDKQLVGAAVVTGLYPAYLYFSAFAIADNLLIPVVVWSAVLLAEVVENTTPRRLTATALLLSLSVGIHGRAVPVVAAGGLLLLMEARERADRRFALAAVQLVGASLVVYWLSGLVTDFNGVTAMADGARQGAGSLLRSNLGIRPLLVLPFTMLGQVIYLVAVTAGIVALGIGLLANASVEKTGKRRTAARFLLLACSGSLAMSGLFTNQGTGDLAFYGRYLEVASVSVLFAGLLVLLDGPPDWYRRVVPPVLLIGACVLSGIRGLDAFGGRLQRLNVSGASLPIEFFGRLDPIGISLFGCGFILLTAYAARKQLPLAFGVLGVVFSLSAVQLIDRASEFIDAVAERNDLPELVAERGAATCVALDQSEVHGFWQGENYRLQSPDIDFPFWRSESGSDLPCPDLVVTSRSDLDSVLSGWVPVAVEPEAPVWLWASPEAQLEHFADTAIVPPPGRPLPALTAEIKIVRVEPPATEVEAYLVVVQITNTSEYTYVPIGNLPLPEGSVRIGFEWRDPDDPFSRMHEPTRREFVDLIRPGESIELEFGMWPDVGDFVVDEGRWLLRAELVQEGMQWAGNAAAGQIEVEIR